MRVLHVTLQDPTGDGADQAALRVAEITRRLAREYDITVASPRQRGVRNRTVDGVHHVHGGLPWGARLRALTWRLSLPLTVLRRRPDLIVESCDGPLPVALVPWPLRRPTIAMLSDQPISHGGQRMRGLRPHRHLLAASDHLGAELGDLFPGSPVTVVPDGLPDEAFTAHHQPRRHVIYLGPLDRTHGVDLLIAAWATVAATSRAELILVGGGPDEDEMRARVARLGLSAQVRFSGRVLPSARFDILAGAHIVVAAGSHHRDALLAAEALAVASPVVAFDLPGVRAVVDADTGVLVPAGDTSGFAQAVLDLLDDPVRARALGDAGPARMAGRRWDAIAPLEAAVYDQALSVRVEHRPIIAPVGGSLGESAVVLAATDAVPVAGPVVALPGAAPGVLPGAVPVVASTPASGPPGRVAVLARSVTGHPRHAIVAVVCLVAAATLAGSSVLTALHPGGSTLADSQHAAGKSKVALTTTLPKTSIPATDPRSSSARTARTRREAARRAAARRAKAPPTAPVVASATTAATTPAPTTTVPASRANATTTPPTTSAPTTTPVLTEHVGATLTCTAPATVTITGSGGGSNTLTATGTGVSRTVTGGSATMTLSVTAGTYRVVDTSTAGDPSTHWGWAPSSACVG